MMEQQRESGAEYVFRVFMTFVVASFIAAAMTYGYSQGAIFFRVSGVAVAFYGFAITSKNLLDMLRSVLNKRMVNRRRDYAMSQIKKHGHKKVGANLVGYRENELSLYHAFLGLQNQTHPIEKIVVVSDGNKKSPRWDSVRDSSDAAEVALVNALSNVQSEEPSSRAPMRVPVLGHILRFLSWLFSPLIQFIRWLTKRRNFFDWVRFVLMIPARIVGGILGTIIRSLIFLFGWVMIDRSGRKPIYQPLPADRKLPFSFQKPPDDDAYMAYLALKAYGPENVEVIHLDFLISDMWPALYAISRNTEMTREERQAARRRIRAKVRAFYETITTTQKKVIVILQPHDGKRQAIYTASRAQLEMGMEWVMFTDSDTIHETVSLMEMMYMTYTHGLQRRVGAVTCDVRIFNTDNWLSFMSSLRYWYAFNMERASQSWGNYVTCISGPGGVYEAKLLNSILDPWLAQSFLGRPRSFGEDRALTNAVLRQGLAVIYTPYARCWTDTPTSVEIWLNQQTRWNKSWYIEFLENITSLWRYGPYLTVEMFYHVLFPLFLAMSLGNLMGAAFRTGQWSYVLIWILTIEFGGWTRAIFAMIMTRKDAPEPLGTVLYGRYYNANNLRFLFFPNYGFLYLGYLLSVRIAALATLLDMGWGTPPHGEKTYSLAA